jgi:hypothetical protein
VPRTCTLGASATSPAPLADPQAEPALAVQVQVAPTSAGVTAFVIAAPITASGPWFVTVNW